MRFKLTLLLIALNVALWSLISWLNQGLGVTSPATRVFPPGLPEIAETFEIRPPEGKVVWKLRRTGDTWRIESPFQWDANTQAVTQMLDQLSKLSIETSFPLAEIKTANPLADYGLTETASTLTLTPPGGKPLTVRIGAATSPASVYLLDPSGERVVVAKDAFLAVVEEGLKSLRSPSIFNLDTGEVRFLTIQERSPDKVRLERVGAEWTFTSPMTARADLLAVEGTLQKLLTAQSAAFYPPDLVTQGLDSPDMRIVIEAAKGRSQTLLIGHPVRATVGQELESPKHYYARLEGNNSSVFALAKEFVDPFRSAQKDFRLRRLLPGFNYANVASVTIKREGRSLTLNHPENAQWVLADDPARPPADPIALAELFKAMGDLEAMEFVNDTPTKAQLTETFATPAAILTFVNTNGVSTTVTLGMKDVAVHAQVGEEPSVYRVPQAFLDGLSVNPLAFRQRVVEQLAREADVVGLKLEPMDGGPAVFLETLDPTKETWQTKLADRPAPWNTPAYREALLTLEAQVRRFAVSRYNGARFHPVSFNPHPLDSPPGSEPRFGGMPWKWRLSAEVLLPGDNNRKRTLVYFLTDRIGATTQGGGSSPHDTTFFLPKNIVEALGVITGTPTFPQAPVPPTPAPGETVSPIPPLPGSGKPLKDAPFLIPPEPLKPTPF